jgi:hypothetical protein
VAGVARYSARTGTKATRLICQLDPLLSICSNSTSGLVRIKSAIDSALASHTVCINPRKEKAALQVPLRAFRLLHKPERRQRSRAPFGRLAFPPTFPHLISFSCPVPPGIPLHLPNISRHITAQSHDTSVVLCAELLCFPSSHKALLIGQTYITLLYLRITSEHRKPRQISSHIRKY